MNTPSPTSSPTLNREPVESWVDEIDSHLLKLVYNIFVKICGRQCTVLAHTAAVAIPAHHIHFYPVLNIKISFLSWKILVKIKRDKVIHFSYIQSWGVRYMGVIKKGITFGPRTNSVSCAGQRKSGEVSALHMRMGRERQDYWGARNFYLLRI